VLVLLPACGRASVEGDVEGVQRLFPAVRPPFAAATGRVEAHDRQVDAFQRRRLGGKVATRIDRSADPRVDALDGICRADHAANTVVVQERHEFRRRGVPQLDDRRVPVAPGVGERDERLQRGGFAYSRQLLGAATSTRPDAKLACAAIEMAVAARGAAPQIAGVIFHTDRGSTYTATTFTALCTRLGIRQSMGRVGSCFDNAAAETFFSSLEWEVLSRNHFRDTIHAQAVVIDWCYTFYNHQRRHSAADGLSPVNYEIRESKTKPEAA
jgi:transposase InsO family protein